MRDDTTLYKARLFADRYKDAVSEKQLAQSFWRDFFHDVFGITDLLATGISFEFPIRISETATTNYIDCLWARTLLIEHKSRGVSLDDAELQARRYLKALPAHLRPPYVVVSDYARIRIVDVLGGDQYEFPLEHLPQELHRFTTIFGGELSASRKPQVEADKHAVELMTRLYKAFNDEGYDGHDLSVFLIRLLFLNFGDDTGMWQKQGRGLFAELVQASPEDGFGLGGLIQEIFLTLNTPEDHRNRNLDERISLFPYVNGGLFSERLPIFSFSASMRSALIETTLYDWSKISPAIFGAMFQTVKDKVERRELGEHYTSEENILKVIRPLFLDRLEALLQSRWNSPAELKRFRQYLSTLNFLDPASGSGNFLIVSYRLLRRLEHKAIARLQELGALERQHGLEGFGNYGLSITLEQFHAIEINEWSSQIARVAMFLADHQMNIELAELTGSSTNRFPLTHSANVFHGNALTVDWGEVCPMNENTYIMGNPPFLGARVQSVEQKQDTLNVFGKIKGVGELDFVSSWFYLASKHINTSGANGAFLSTNSITQGEQVAILWDAVHSNEVEISFAHRTFLWDNEASGKASVFCVVIGLSSTPPTKRQLWSYATVRSEPVLSTVKNINGYLLDAPNEYVRARSSSIANLPRMDFGSMPNDGGHLSNISEDEAEHIRSTDEIASKYLHRLLGAQEFIQGKVRYCLWLKDASPADLNRSPVLRQRVQEVRTLREASTRPSTRKLASTPHLFGEIRQPTTDYLIVPRHSSERRDYIPLMLCDPATITNDSVLVVPNADHFLFGVLQSRVFNLWNSSVSGRLKGDTRISSTITYNNFPLPTPTDRQRDAVSACAETVLTVRAQYSGSSLADLYGPTSMPADLRKAHTNLDREVVKIYGLRSSVSDETLLSALFQTYVKQIGLLPS